LWRFGDTKIGNRVLDAVSKEYKLVVTQRAENAVRGASKNKILAGPFSGMQYPQINHRGYLNLVSKYLGVFESELHISIEHFLATRSYSTILNIGTADGLYLVGLCVRIPNAVGIGWEMDPYMQQMTQLLAIQNGIEDRVTIRGLCTPAELNGVQRTGRTLIVCDCEGAEDELLTPKNLSGLSDYDIIVECHDMFAPGVTERLKQRFASTHAVSFVPAKWRTLSDLTPEMLSLLPGGDLDRYNAVEEMRSYDMGWLVMESRLSTE